MSRTFACCRVSTQSQTAESQVLEIASARFIVATRHIYSEAISEKVPALERPQFKRMFEKMDEGEISIVAQLDRLGRNTSDVLATVAMLNYSQGVRAGQLEQLTLIARAHSGAGSA